MLPIAQTFSIDKSLKEAPPKNPKGLKFLKRVVVDLDKDLIIDDDKQARHKHCHADHVRDIHDSMSINGWIYNQQPPWGTFDTKSMKYILHDGFHRTHAAKKSNWHNILLDVYEAESNLATVIYQLKSNENHTPKRGSDEGDIVNAALQAMRDKLLASDDNSIREFVKETAGHLSKHKKETILVKIKNSCPDSKYRTYFTKGVGPNNLSTACKYEFGIPYGGDANYHDTGAFGYVTTEKTGRMTMMNAIKLMAETYEDQKIGVFTENKIPPVLIFAYIEAPGHNFTLREQREVWQNSFNKTLELLKSFFEFQTGKKFDKDFPIKFGGFLPQLIDKDPAKGGNPIETTIVDINSKSVDWKKLLK